MPRYPDDDPYLDRQSRVLKNRLNITDSLVLEQVEAALVATRSYELTRKPLAGRFDLIQLQAIHQCLFGDVYDWAGELRTIDISKGASNLRITLFRECGRGII